MDYAKLLSAERLRTSRMEGRDLSTEMLSDKARLVLSASFRRLQTKAQVFSLENNAAVRTRLTHSLEVAMYGELIAEKTFALLLKAGKIAEEFRLPFVSTIENACLLHDIGNPPFGHLGEFAIRKWFEGQPDIATRWREGGIPDEVATRHYHAFANFDGNAQGFRNVTRLQWLDDEFGLNLTCGLLACMVKYLTDQGPSERPFESKIGYFPLEAPLVLDVWSRLGLKTDAGKPAQRHPLTYLMEAADDIAYCVSDIEDALEKRIVSEKDFIDSLSVDGKRFLPDAKTTDAKHARFLKFRINLTRHLVDTAADVFIKHHDGICAGSLHKPLLRLDEKSSKVLDELKAFSKKYIFVAAEAVNVELSGFNIVRSLLTGLGDLLKLQSAGFAKLLPDSPSPPGYKEMTLEKRLFSLLPNKHRLAYQHGVSLNPGLEPILRAHMVIDYVAGMTDGHAVRVFNMLTGRV